MKRKRYIIEMCNDFAKKFYENGMIKEAARLDAHRNGYIIGTVSDVEIMKEIIRMLEREDLR